MHTATYMGPSLMFDAYVVTLIGGYVEENLHESAAAPSMEDCRSSVDRCLRGGETKGLQDGNINYLEELQETIPGRAFFKSNEGYIGLCPAEAVPRDRVCVILGCDSPLLLRPVAGQNDHYQLVGECYVHGIMECEALVGAITPPWSRTFYRDGAIFPIWTLDGERTHDDPRLGPLPPGWRRSFGRDDNLKYARFDDDDKPKEPWFENIETGEETRSDPRLTLEALIARGVDIKELILV